MHASSLMIALRRRCLLIKTTVRLKLLGGVSALVDIANIAPLEARDRVSDREVAGVLLRTVEEATFAEARCYAGRCDSCAAANDVLKNSALADQCAHCSACVNSALVGLGQRGVP